MNLFGRLPSTLLGMIRPSTGSGRMVSVPNHRIHPERWLGLAHHSLEFIESFGKSSGFDPEQCRGVEGRLKGVEG